MTLRNLLFGVTDMAFSLPRVLVLALGAWAYWRDLATLGQVTAAMLYMEMFYAPFDRLVMTLDELQVGIASTTEPSVGESTKERKTATYAASASV